MVTATIENRQPRIDCGPDLGAMEALRDHFRYHPAGYRYMPKYVNGRWDGWIRMMRYGRVATGLFLDQLPGLQRKFTIRVEDQRAGPNHDACSLPEGTRDYQQACYQAMRESNHGGLVLSGTGTGKTFMATLYFRSLDGPGLFIVDELTLLLQAQTAIANLLEEKVGIIGGGEFSPQRISVATVQTLQKRLPKLALQPEAVIIDEIHEAVNNRTREVLRALQPKAIFGLTATAQLRKKETRFQIMALTGPVIYTYSLKQGIEDGHLTKGIVIRIPYLFSPMLLKRLRAEERYETLVVNNTARNRFVSELALAAVGQGHPTIVLVDRLAHLDNLNSVLQNGSKTAPLYHGSPQDTCEGIRYQVLSGEDPKEVRKQAIEEMKAGSLPLIVTNKIFGKGVDIPNLSVIIDAAGRASYNAAQQKFGRGSRQAAGKDGLIHFDIADPQLPATDQRLKALRRLKVPIIRPRQELTAPELVAWAEHKLESVK
jgi:superfamily II DNA or RNA helicase